MASKMVTDRQKAANALLAALGRHKKEAAAAFLPLIQPYLEDNETAPDIEFLQNVLARRLNALKKVLVIADEANVQERGDDAPARTRRDTAARIVVDRMGLIRRLVDGAFGAGSCGVLLGIEGSLPRDAVAILRIGQRAVDRLEDPAFKLPEALLGGVQLDSGPWLAALKPEVEELDNALLDVFNEDRGAIATKLRKDEALEELDRSFLTTARLAEALYRYCAMSRVADRVRPTRRPGAATPDGEIPTTPDPEATPAPDPMAPPPQQDTDPVLATSTLP